MATLDSDKTDLLVKAVLAWTGYENKPFPSRVEKDVKAVVPEPDFTEIFRTIKLLEDDFYNSDSYLTAVTISDMYKECQNEFMARHSELPSIIAEAFAWCYTYDYK